MSRFKEFTGRLRGMVHRAPGPAAPGARPFDWDAPLEGSEERRDPAAALTVGTLPLRPEPPAAPRGRGGSGGASVPPPLKSEREFISRERIDEPRGAHWRTKADVADFKSVYAEAGIATPAHGYGVDKVADMLANPRFGSRPRDVRANAALAALEAAQVPLRDVIDDAVLRHKALAAFEAAKALELQAIKTRSRARIDALQEQVRVFLAARNGEIDSLNRAVQAARQQLAQLQARKQREEDRLLRVVTHFVEPRPIAAPPPRGAIVSPLLPADPALKPAPPVPPAAPRPAAAVPAPAAAPGPPGPPGPPKPGSA
jgi:hypothetical protein